MLETKRYQKLFSTPLMRFQVPDCAVLNAALLMEGERLRAKDDGVQKSNRGGWHSKGNLFADEAPSVARLEAAARAAGVSSRTLTSTRTNGDRGATTTTPPPLPSA